MKHAINYVRAIVRNDVLVYTNAGIEFYLLQIKLLRVLQQCWKQCWKPAHVLINLYHRATMSSIGVVLFLHHSRNVVINRIKVWAVGWPHVRSSECGSPTTKKLHCLTCTMSRCLVSLKEANLIYDASEFRWLAEQQFVSIVYRDAVALCTSTKYKCRRHLSARLWTGGNTVLKRVWNVSLLDR